MLDEKATTTRREEITDALEWVRTQFPELEKPEQVRVALASLDPGTTATRIKREPRVVMRADNSDPLAQAIVAWRKDQAKREKKKLFHILYNRSIAEMVTARPSTLDALGKIRGMGAFKLKQYGAALLAIIAEHTTETTTPALTISTNRKRREPTPEEIEALKQYNVQVDDWRKAIIAALRRAGSRGMTETEILAISDLEVAPWHLVRQSGKVKQVGPDRWRWIKTKSQN